MPTLIEIFNYATTIVALASAVSAMTPTKVDDTFVQKYLVRFVDALAINIGHAKNETH